MALCQGDVMQFKELKRSSVDVYCIKLKAYVDAVASPKEKQMSEVIKNGRKR